MVFPMRSFLREHSPGERRRTQIFDSTAPDSLEEFVSALSGLLINPAIKWFNLRMRDDALDMRDDVRAWMDLVVDALFSIINSTELNFNTQAHEMLLDMGAFGTGVLSTNDKIDKFVVQSVPLNFMYIKESHTGDVDTAYRKLDLSARQALQKFGPMTPPDIAKAAEENQEKKFQFLHGVFPRTDRHVDLPGAKNMPFASTWIYLDKKILVRDSGFPEFPYLVTRWTKTAEEDYGRSPAMKVFPTIMMINEMKRTNLRGAQLTVAPPIIVEDEDSMRPLRTIPASIIYKRPGSDPSLPRPLITGARPDLGRDLINDEKADIRRGFFLHLFEVPELDRQTAQEFMGRMQDNMRKLSPHVHRIQKEFLGPFVLRLFNVLMRANQLPAPPDAIKGKDFDIDYVSPLAQSQKASDITGIVRWFQANEPIIQLNPRVVDNLDMDGIARYTGRILNVPQKLFRSVEDVAGMRQQQQQTQQQATLAQLAGSEASAMKDAGTAVEKFNKSQK